MLTLIVGGLFFFIPRTLLAGDVDSAKHERSSMICISGCYPYGASVLYFAGLLSQRLVCEFDFGIGSQEGPILNMRIGLNTLPWKSVPIGFCAQVVAYNALIFATGIELISFNESIPGFIRAGPLFPITRNGSSNKPIMPWAEIGLKIVSW